MIDKLILCRNIQIVNIIKYRMYLKILCKNIIKKNFSKVTKIKMNDKLFLDLVIPYAFRLQPKNIIISVNKNLAIHHQIKYNVKL